MNDLSNGGEFISQALAPSLVAGNLKAGDLFLLSVLHYDDGELSKSSV